MQFSQISSPYQGIIQSIERESRLGLGVISDNSAPDYYLAYFLGKVNEAGDMIRQWISKVNDEWTSQDINDTDDNPKVKDFSDNTQKYTLDSDITKIRKVQIHDIISASKAFTVTIATPAVFTLLNHGLIVNDIVRFSTTDTLPTGLSIDTDYYVISAGLTDNLFRVSTSEGGAVVDTSGTQAGVHSVIINKIGWVDLNYYYEKDRADDLYGQKSGIPTKYFFQGRELITNIPIDITKTDKYRITQDRHAHEFVIGDTTAEPGIDKQFHWLYIYIPVMDWAVGKHPDIYAKCKEKIYGNTTMDNNGREILDPNSLKGRLIDHYTEQNRNMIYKLRRKKVNYY